MKFLVSMALGFLAAIGSLAAFPSSDTLPPGKYYAILGKRIPDQGFDHCYEVGVRIRPGQTTIVEFCSSTPAFQKRLQQSHGQYLCLIVDSNGSGLTYDLGHCSSAL